MDNGRLKLENFNGVLYCEAYLDTEYTIADIRTMIDEIKKNFTPPVDVILNKTGSYSLASNAQRLLARNIKEFRNFVYVVDTDAKQASAEFAVANYMKSYNTRIARNKKEAFAILISNDE